MTYQHQRGGLPSRRSNAEANALGEANLGLVGGAMRSMGLHSLDGAAEDDLRQEGMIALMRAADRWDAERGIKFSTYAVCCIKRRIWRAIRSRGLIAVPDNITGDERRDLLDRLRPVPLCFLAGHRGDGREREPMVPAPDDGEADRVDLRAVLLDAIGRLPKRWAHLVIRRYGLDGQPPAGLAELARDFRVSKQRIGQVVRLALKRLRRRPELATAAT